MKIDHYIPGEQLPGIYYLVDMKKLFFATIILSFMLSCEKDSNDILVEYEVTCKYCTVYWLMYDEGREINPWYAITEHGVTSKKRSFTVPDKVLQDKIKNDPVNHNRGVYIYTEYHVITEESTEPGNVVDTFVRDGVTIYVNAIDTAYEVQQMKVRIIQDGITLLDTVVVQDDYFGLIEND